MSYTNMTVLTVIFTQTGGDFNIDRLGGGKTVVCYCVCTVRVESLPVRL